MHYAISKKGQSHQEIRNTLGSIRLRALTASARDICAIRHFFAAPRLTGLQVPRDGTGVALPLILWTLDRRRRKYEAWSSFVLSCSGYADRIALLCALRLSASKFKSRNDCDGAGSC